MSGIAGIWGRPEAARLRVMATALAHRGPDDERFWMQPSAGVGFAIRRLAIIDLPGGHQPIANEDGTIVTICDGEIYNYRELRDELAARGHAFRSASDTEVIVHLYEEQGPAFLTRLRGMFALAVWDGRLGQLLLARDRAGKKPLYYAESPGEFRFASEIQALVRVQEGAVEIDRQALLDYLAWVVVPAPRTIYRQVRVVLPGHALIVRAREVIESRPYWQLEYTPKTPLSEREAVDRVDDLLREAVRLRLRSDVPVGVFLSGGIDSGLITAMAAQESAGPIRTLAVGFEQSEFDERPLARQVADRYGTEHHELVVRPDARTLLPEIAAAYDQPFADSSAVPSYCAAQAARPFVRVVLNGDGGDEVFAGYRRHVAAWLESRAAFLPRGVWRAMVQRLSQPRSFRTPYAFWHRLARGLSLLPQERYLAWAVDGMTMEAVEALAIGDWWRGLEPPWRLAGGSGDGLDAMLARDFGVVLPNELLVKMDIATMAHGLEARSPFLDHVLVEAVARFPNRLKLHGFQTKPLLRRLARRYLPAAVCRAPKRGFEIPRIDWLRGPLREMRDDVILSSSGLLGELFVRDRLEEFVRGGGDREPGRWATQVWILLMLGLWDAMRRDAGGRGGV